jgi:hypothetical protein
MIGLSWPTQAWAVAYGLSNEPEDDSRPARAAREAERVGWMHGWASLAGRL